MCEVTQSGGWCLGIRRVVNVATPSHGFVLLGGEGQRGGKFNEMKLNALPVLVRSGLIVSGNESC